MPTNTLLLELQARREQVKDLQKEIERLKRTIAESQELLRIKTELDTLEKGTV